MGNKLENGVKWNLFVCWGKVRFQLESHVLALNHGLNLLLLNMHGKVGKIVIKPVMGIVPITLSSDELCPDMTTWCPVNNFTSVTGLEDIY